MKASDFNIILVLQANCASSPLTNKAKNALSLAKPFSVGLAGAKIAKKPFGQ